MATVMTPGGELETKVKTHFTKMDKDGDGQLSIEEMEARGFALGMHNKSGSDGIISNVHGDVNADAQFVPLKDRGGVMRAKAF